MTLEGNKVTRIWGPPVHPFSLQTVFSSSLGMARGQNVKMIEADF